MTALALNGADAGRLFDALNLDVETAWVLLAVPVDDGRLLLGRELVDVPAHAYVERGSTRLHISSAGFVPAFSEARREGLVAVFVHTHPRTAAAHSRRDHEVDRLLRTHALDRDLPGYASLVLGGTSAQPRAAGSSWVGKSDAVAIDRVRVAGREMRVLLSDAGDRDSLPIFDRQVLAFGEDGQHLLSSLKIGVVGLGGTGSATAEQLARLGVGDLVVLDDDAVDESNVTRIHESSRDDVGMSKVELAKRQCESFGTGTRVHAVEQSVASRAGVAALTGCDLVFGCTDDNAGRLVLNRLAYRYLIPLIDSGVVVDTDAGVGAVRGVAGRVTLVVPGEPCLLCRRQVDADLASEEMMAPEARRALAGEGYARGAAGPAPSVVSYTTAVAALAVGEMLGRLFGYSQSLASQILILFHDQSIKRAGHPMAPGHMCGNPSEWALGDTEPPLGILGLR